MPRDPDWEVRRAAWEADEQASEWARFEARLVAAWSGVALRRLEAAQLWRRAPTRVETADAAGEALSGVVALYLALAAARRYANHRPSEPGPMDRAELDRLYGTALAFRDAAMHMDDKARRINESRIVPDRDGLVVLAPPGKRGTTPEIARLSWTDYEAAARACRDWVDIDAVWVE